MKSLALVAALIGCGHASLPTFAVTSTAFAANAEIPRDHTCEGADRAPPLAWAGAPAAARGFALIVDDPDAPSGTFVHWVRAAIPPTATTTDAPGVDGNNDFGTAGWRGPCPPSGRHHYHFKVYALDALIGEPGLTKAALEHAIDGHVIAQGELVGTYEKQAR